MNLDIGDTKEIISACEKRKIPLKQVAYMLGTTWLETANKMKPVEEANYVSRFYQMRYLKSKKYFPFYGRGYVQITWDYNYEKASKALGVDFVKNPELTLEPKWASQILILGCTEGWFTGKKLSDYINENGTDYYNARRVVNGVDRAKDIAGYASEYERDLIAYGYSTGDTITLPASFLEDYKKLMRSYGINVS